MYNLFETASPWKWGQKSELARRAGISKQYLSDILNCRKRALPELAAKLEEEATKMSLPLAKEYFMYPEKAPESIFNTPDLKKRKELALKKRLEKDTLFMCDVQLIAYGIASRGRRLLRRKMSKRDLRIIGMMAQQAVRSIEFQSTFDLEGAIKQRDQLLEIARKAEQAGISSSTIILEL
jgi:transcriptional regulator with XRE-family HTH domain